MSVAEYTPEEERRWKLRPLPEAPFIGQAASHALNLEYEMKRKLYRQRHPLAPKVDE